MTRGGFLLSVEGVDGAGKSTQVASLATALAAAGERVVVVREPGGTRAGELIRELALHRVLDPPLEPWTEALLMAAARAQLLAEVVLPALARGEVVVADRFVDSTLAYQGAGRGLPRAALREVHRAACGDVWPDLTVLLSLPVPAALERRRAVRLPLDRMEADGEAGMLARVAAGFTALAAEEPGRVVPVDAARPADEVAAEVLALVRARLEGRRAPAPAASQGASGGGAP